MGSCVSLHKGQESNMKLAALSSSVGSQNDKILIPSPVKPKPDTVNGGDRTVADVALISRYSPARFGSKEEAFFDSQPWIESDAEDDFFSVNGDFTPSRGSTPSRHSFSSGNLLMNKTVPIMEVPVNSVPEVPSPPNKKKRLSDLFKDSLRSNDHLDELIKANDTKILPAKTKAEANSVVHSVSSNGTPYYSDEISTNGVTTNEEKSEKAAQCCYPRSLLNRNSVERKKRMSPVNGVA